MTRNRLTCFQREALSLGPRLWFPLAGPNPWRCRITNESVTPAASHRVTPATANGRTAVTGSSTDDTSATLTTLSGLQTVSICMWIYRGQGGGWVDGTCSFWLDFFNATGRGINFDARTTSTSIEAVKTSSGAQFYQRVGSTSTVNGKWNLIGASTDLNGTAAPKGYINGVEASMSGSNNGYTAGSMDASVAHVFADMNLNLVRDAFLFPAVLTDLEWGRLAAANPDR